VDQGLWALRGFLRSRCLLVLESGSVNFTSSSNARERSQVSAEDKNLEPGG
jgi:hypothetical protein